MEGRKGDMIISGGLNVYPREIELLLDECAGVQESAVVGIEDADFGERVVAFVVAEPDASVDPDGLRSELKENLASFKVPKTITVIDELPRNSMGKVQKTVLRSN